jgi:hypothetical protein
MRGHFLVRSKVCELWEDLLVETGRSVLEDSNSNLGCVWS